jgi:hypothetical protein
MRISVDLPPAVASVYEAHARTRGLPIEDVIREVLVDHQPAIHVDIEQGFGLFSSPEDSALLDEICGK